MNYVKTTLFFFFASMLFACQTNSPGWKLVWEENFDKDDFLDPAIWSKVPRGNAGNNWDHYLSDYEALYDVKDGKLILRGIVNPGLPGDTMPYLTGGVRTKNNKGFYRGKIEICAKLGDAQGAWPAIWMLPFDNTPWPYGGEIDILERLNYEAIGRQNVESYYVSRLKQRTPRKNGSAPIRNGEYNTYGVAMYPDSLVFFINGERTFCYPRVETDLTWSSTDGDGQFPFDKPFYLMMDMQLGGSWAGEVNPADLPVEMHIDWVRFYEWK